MGDTVRLRAVTYFGSELPQYIWQLSHSHIVAIEPDPNNASVAWARALGEEGQTATLTVFDRANGMDRQVNVVLLYSDFTLPGGVSMEMVYIPPGTFMMGSEGFYLGKYEVTQEQWEAVMGTTPWARDGRSGSNYPATHISWNDAQEFIRRLNEWSGSDVYRLPSEAEWEYACRAGTSTRWSFGNDESQLTHYAWFWGNSSFSVQLVGTKRANPWGLYDMHGNVWEWVQDCWDGPGDDCSMRVLRGGSWFNRPSALRSAFRDWNSTEYRDVSNGFRVARRF